MPLRLANLISIVFHPILMVLYATITLFYGSSYMMMVLPLKLQYILTGLIFITTVLMPLLSTILMMHKGQVGSIHMQTREERSRPLFTTLLYYVITLYFVHRIHLPLIFTKLLTGATLVMAAVWITNYFMKISLHTVAAGGYIAFVAVLPFYVTGNFANLFIISILVAGLVGSARAVAGNHTKSQLYWGYALGFAGMLLALVSDFYR